MSKRRYRIGHTHILLVALVVACGPAAIADWQPDPDDKQQVAAQQAIERVRKKAPDSEQYFEQAYGYAVLTSATRLAFGFGGAYGRGLVFEQDQLVGKTGYWQFTSGIQAGINSFSMIVFFKDKQALDDFKQRKAQFIGQASIAFANFGVSGTPAYHEGVAIVAVNRFGLIGELAYGGTKFTYKDLPLE